MEYIKKQLRKIGRNICEIRSVKNISLAVISLDTKIDITRLDKIELGETDFYVDELAKIADSLNVEVTDLISDEPFSLV